MTPTLTWKVTQDPPTTLRETEPPTAIPNPTAENTEPAPLAQPDQQFVPLDLNAEQQEFTDLIAFINANKDAGTVVTAMAVEEFMAGIDEPPHFPCAEPQEQ